MAMHYEHTQIGSVTIVAIGLLAAMLLVAAVAVEAVALAVAAVFLLVMLAQFGWLTVKVDDEALELRMGIGLIRRRILLKTIARAEAVRTHWIWGWGIRWTPHGRMWNVSGTRGVELQYHSGRRFRVGSDEPERLAAAIQARIGPASGR